MPPLFADAVGKGLKGALVALREVLDLVELGLPSARDGGSRRAIAIADQAAEIAPKFLLMSLWMTRGSSRIWSNSPWMAPMLPLMVLSDIHDFGMNYDRVEALQQVELRRATRSTRRS